MSENDSIQPGDTVTVYFSTHPPLMGVVIYTAQATGDCWRIQTDQRIFYVQQFDFMEKHRD